MKRGEVWLTDFGPVRGAEQAGQRPSIIFQDDATIQFSRTVVLIPITGNLKLASSPMCLPILAGEGGLHQNSVALCNQIRGTDKKRVMQRIGALSAEALADVQLCVAKTLGM